MGQGEVEGYVEMAPSPPREITLGKMLSVLGAWTVGTDQGRIRDWTGLGGSGGMEQDVRRLFFRVEIQLGSRHNSPVCVFDRLLGLVKTWPFRNAVTAY
jgi:hypothetical protein